ncbi:hypothetical protein PsorP6_009936 [Peronosclerospora sorghi]|uniref:Uncharacterized protein n=1 Tax=Peronosclerospora sorghi TaxID=230839 RepID=A0ACC0VVP2_9STRA|nr:hypothetical protein PsorP6_009936 [Peronosclerospora sorghi]
MVLDSLYGVAATNDTLPAIVKAVDGRAEGEDGVANVFRILNELKHAMLFSGTATLADIRYGGSTGRPFVCPSWLATTTIVTMKGGSISMEFLYKDHAGSALQGTVACCFQYYNPNQRTRN